MTREEIIRMAREAGLYVEPHGGGNWAVPLVSDLPERVERFAALVAAAEREACAKVCEMTYEGAFEGARPCFDTPQECAAAIRARGEK